MLIFVYEHLQGSSVTAQRPLFFSTRNEDPLLTPNEIVKHSQTHKHMVMSVHNWFLSDQMLINQLCERSYISL